MRTEDFSKKYLEITNTKKTDLINIAAYGKTPEEAQMISQGVADNFLALMTKLNKEDNSTTLKFLDERIKIAKEEMETAEINCKHISRNIKSMHLMNKQKLLLLI